MMSFWSRSWVSWFWCLRFVGNDNGGWTQYCLRAPAERLVVPVKGQGGCLGAFHCPLLRWLFVLELHHDYTGYGTRHELVAVAERLGLVHYFLHGLMGFRPR